jgi:hypothetical protein
MGLQYNIGEPTEILPFWPGQDTITTASLFKNNSLSIILPSDSKRITGSQHFYSIPTTSGDKSIKIFTTYSQDGLTWHTEEAFLSFHVNNCYEEHETFFIIMGLIVAILAALDPITNLIKKIIILFQKPQLNNIDKKKRK